MKIDSDKINGGHGQFVINLHFSDLTGDELNALVSYALKHSYKHSQKRSKELGRCEYTVKKDFNEVSFCWRDRKSFDEFSDEFIDPKFLSKNKFIWGRK